MWCCAPVSGLGTAARPADRRGSGGSYSAGTADLADSAGLVMASSSPRGRLTSLPGRPGGRAAGPCGLRPGCQGTGPDGVGDKHAEQAEVRRLLVTEDPHLVPGARERVKDLESLGRPDQ